MLCPIHFLHIYLLPAFLSCQDCKCSKCCKVIKSRKQGAFLFIARIFFRPFEFFRHCRRLIKLWKCSHIPRTITNLPNLIPRDQTQRKRNGKTFHLLFCCVLLLLGYLQGLHGSVAPKCLLIYFFALGCFYVSILGDR